MTICLVYVTYCNFDRNRDLSDENIGTNFLSLARKTEYVHLVSYLTSLSDEAISKSQNGVSPGSSTDDTIEN